MSTAYGFHQVLIQHQTYTHNHVYDMMKQFKIVRHQSHIKYDIKTNYVFK